jgi:xanthine dehydrogenase accessory factor
MQPMKTTEEEGKNMETNSTEGIPDNLFMAIADRDPLASCHLATVVDGEHIGEQTLYLNGIPRWQKGDQAFFSKYEKEILAVQGSTLLTLGGCRVFCELVGGRRDLVICGAGHVSIPVIQLGKQIGFHVTVIDDRPHFANEARRAGADQVLCDNFSSAMDTIQGSPDTYFVIVTRGHRYDTDCLRQALGKPNAYIGMMGSRKRVKLVKDQLLEEGADPAAVALVHSPIGLSIGAESPEEIAISILAEIIQVKNAHKRISSFHKELLESLTGKNLPGNKAVLCTIVSKKGSAPREAGTKMLVFFDGSIQGTIGGGCAESAIIHTALRMLHEEDKSPRLELVDMTGREAEDLGMVCGGTILVYLEYLNA